jgi:hypothetical protein
MKLPIEEALRPPPDHEPPSQLFARIGAKQEKEDFLEDLRHNAQELLGEVALFQQRPDKSRDDVALGIYLEVVLKETVLGIDPFAPRFPGDEEHQVDRQAITFLATEHVARNWLTKHPTSQAAQLVQDLGLFAPRAIHHQLLYELWPTLIGRLIDERQQDSTDSGGGLSNI